jgi:hypothetical protein
VNFFSAATGKNWVSTETPDKQDQQKLTPVEGHKNKLNQLLLEVLLAENLIILTGLGTSMCVVDAEKKPVAPTMDELWKTIEKNSGNQFAGVKAKVKYVSPASGDNIETLLSLCQLSQQFEPDKIIEEFITQAELHIVERCCFVTQGIDLSIHEGFLRKVARRPTRQPRLRLFTTNYDLTFETAASHTRFVAVDGFSHTQPQEFDGIHFSYDFVVREQDREAPDYIPNVFHLYKMHGSVDWEQSGSQIVKSGKPQNPLIIYPRSSKFETSYDQPFLEMMSRFQLALRQPNTGLLIVGFGFSDRHISQPVLSAIRSNVGLKAIIVDPTLETAATAPILQVKSLIEQGDWRLTLISAKFEELVPVLPDLVAETEDERHQDRIRKLGTRA